ncbi:MAG: hypothetical protein ABFD89_22650 [Bryobacteraceae bacterium]
MNYAGLITFDIETCATRNLKASAKIAQEAMDKRPAKNAAKAIQEAWDTSEERQKRSEEAVSKTAVDPMLAECLVVVVMADVDFDGQHALDDKPVVYDCMTDGEREMLSVLADDLREHAGPETIWSGHNIAGFDLPVLLNRWLALGITPPMHFPQFMGRYWRGHVYDTMQRIPNNRGGFVSLDDACSMFGMEGKPTMWKGEPMTGARVGEAYESGEFKLICDYCAKDVEVERELYNRLTCNGTWGTYGVEDDELAEEIAKLRASGLSESAKALAIMSVLEGAGRIPRVAA